MKSLAQSHARADITLRADGKDHYRFTHATDISPVSLRIEEEAKGARRSLGIENHCRSVFPI
jgi:hypothetical protein